MQLRNVPRPLWCIFSIGGPLPKLWQDESFYRDSTTSFTHCTVLAEIKLEHKSGALGTAIFLESGRDDGHLAPPLPGGTEGIEHAFAHSLPLASSAPACSSGALTRTDVACPTLPAYC